MAGVRLKEQDAVIELIRERTARYFAAASPAPASAAAACARAFAEVEALLNAHCAAGAAAEAASSSSELARLCAGVGRVFLPLDLVGALRRYDASFHITERRFILPSFKEVREILNLATVSSLGGVELVTLDADDTIYSDGGVLAADSPMIVLVARLLGLGVAVSLVTAAAYPGAPERFERRLAGLLAALAFAIECGAPAEPLLSRFFVMGGECNQLLRCRCVADAVDGARPRVVLEELPAEAWKAHRGVRWNHASVSALLDAAQGELEERARALRLEVDVVRKERAVGVVASAGSASAAARLTYENLEELALAVQARLGAGGVAGAFGGIPYCAFNGGHDVFVDVGNKALGVRTLQSLLGVAQTATVHLGDRFTRTGNDERTRSVASTLWVAGPHETEYLLTLLVERVRERRRAAASAAAAAAAAAAESESASVAAEPASPQRAGAGAGTSAAASPRGASSIPPLSPVAVGGGAGARGGIDGGGGGGSGAQSPLGSLSARSAGSVSAGASAAASAPAAAAGPGVGAGHSEPAAFYGSSGAAAAASAGSGSGAGGGGGGGGGSAGDARSPSSHARRTKSAWDADGGVIVAQVAEGRSAAASAVKAPRGGGANGAGSEASAGAGAEGAL